MGLAVSKCHVSSQKRKSFLFGFFFKATHFPRPMQIGHGTTVDGRSPESPVLLPLRSTLFLSHTKYPPYALRMQSYVKILTCSIVHVCTEENFMP